MNAAAFCSLMVELSHIIAYTIYIPAPEYWEHGKIESEQARIAQCAGCNFDVLLMSISDYSIFGVDREAS